MMMNLLSLSLQHCPVSLLMEKAHLPRVFEELADYLAVQPVKLIVLSTVTSYDTPDEDGLTGCLLAMSGYLYVRTWPGSPNQSVSLNLAAREEWDMPRFLNWLETHFQVQHNDVLVSVATQGKTLPRAPLPGKEAQNG